MPCPYLEGEILKRCAALKGAMVLSVSELKDYCATEDSFEGCRFFKERLLKKSKTTQKSLDYTD